MKRNLSICLFTYLFLYLLKVKSQGTTPFKSIKGDLERIISVEDINPNLLNYNLSSHASGKVKITFINKPVDNITIKIYDILGTIIVTDKLVSLIDLQIDYELRDSGNKTYVVKVESGRDNLIKRIHF